MTQTPPEIEVTSDGPYRVSGDIELLPKRIVVSELGEPLAWASSEPIPHSSEVLLCRCGESKTKPFCDESHLGLGFNGTENASTDTFAEAEKTYSGPGLTVHRVGSLCEHASFCANRTTDWYQMLPDSGDVNVRTQIVGMIEHCPSGALVYEFDGETVEPNLSIAISPVEDGPYWVTGGVTIKRSDGLPLETRNRVTLCRCGHSLNKPLCDGSHTQLGFIAKNPTEPTLVPLSSGPPADSGLAGVARRIVVGVSGSEVEDVCIAAALVAGAGSSQVTIVHVGPGPEDLFSLASDTMRSSGLPAECLSSLSLGGHTAAALTRFAEDDGAGLIVLGRGGDRVARVPHEVAYHSPCDVLLVRSSPDRRFRGYQRILIATDGSATADRAARRGYALARVVGASVDLVFVGHPDTGDLVVSDTMEVYGYGVETQPWFLRGDPAANILETAESTNTNLIVVGNKGLTKTRMFLGGSVPGAVLNGAKNDVLLCRTVRQMESELEPGEGGVVERHGEQMAAYVDSGGQLHLMSARCTHLGCTVAWNANEKTFDCPCHGSRFGPLGEVIDGPATRPLADA